MLCAIFGEKVIVPFFTNLCCMERNIYLKHVCVLPVTLEMPEMSSLIFHVFRAGDDLVVTSAALRVFKLH